MTGSGMLLGYVPDGDLGPVPEADAVAAVRLVDRLVPAEEQPSIRAMLGLDT